MRFVIFISLIFGFIVAKDYNGYNGSGGMLEYKIQNNVYEYHYDNGFTGDDAAGWDPNLQYAWSRIAAANICYKKEIFNEKIIDLLIEKFGENKSVHKIIGIDFHAVQIYANKNFCSDERLKELEEIIPKFKKGNFPKKF